MTATDVTETIMGNRWRRNLVIPTYTPRGWWECDVFELTAAGYFREYEVKLTVADFRADKRKSRTKWVTEPVAAEHRENPWQTFRHVQRPGDSKHDLLDARDPQGPSRFWYVVPAGLLLPEMIPAWAGLIEIEEQVKKWGRHFVERETRPAPVLHRTKCTDVVVNHARGICYWRMHELYWQRHRERRAANKSPITEVDHADGE